MSTYVDIHIIQSLPPSCVNRDDSGSPKSAVYGGVRRLRVSSQSWKRATRLYFNDLLDAKDVGVRTKRVVEVLAERIAEDFGVILGVREIVTKALEDARGQKIVNKSQEADVTVTAPRSVLDHVEQYDAAVFEELFIVASVSFVEGEELSAEVCKTTAEKCPRCWNYRELGGNPNHPSVCERCGDVLDAIGYEEAGSDA